MMNTQFLWLTLICFNRPWSLHNPSTVQLSQTHLRLQGHTHTIGSFRLLLSLFAIGACLFGASCNLRRFIVAWPPSLKLSPYLDVPLILPHKLVYFRPIPTHMRRPQPVCACWNAVMYRVERIERYVCGAEDCLAEEIEAVPDVAGGFA